MNTKGYAHIGGLELYYEIHGSGEPLILLHGGLGSIDMLGENLSVLAQTRQVIGVDLQAHGRTADIDRPLEFELLANDIAGLIDYLGLKQADVMGYSLGGLVALNVAIHHPERVRKLITVSVPFKRSGWYPEVLEGMRGVTAAAAESMKPSPLYQLYSQIAPRPHDFPVLLTKVGDMLRADYDWTSEVKRLKMPVLLVYGDADSIPASHMAEFYSLLGGSQKDAGWDHAYMPQSQLAVLPGTTHYNSFASPLLPAIVTPFLTRADEKLPVLGEHGHGYEHH
jgi:pimeloyl-ACP methyl ester carboxylesterase